MSSMTLNDIKDHHTIGSLTTSGTKCFIRVEGSRSDTRLVFVNNTAGKGGDVLYGGLVALGWDGDWNCLLSFKNISDMSQQSDLSPITSNPSRVCFCNDTEPDCLTVANPKTYPVWTDHHNSCSDCGTRLWNSHWLHLCKVFKYII